MHFLQRILVLVQRVIFKKWCIFFIAIFVGIVSILPYYLVQFSLGPEYLNMPLLATDSEGEYLGRIHELEEGHYSAASSVFFEYKDWPSTVPAIGEWLYFIPVHVFNVSVVSVNMFYKFLLPVILFLLVYVFLKDITKNSVFWSVLGALVVTIGFDITSIYFLKSLLFGDLSGYISPWTRPVNPITGMLALSGCLIFTYRIFTKISKGFFIAGLLLGLMVGYFFSFVYAGILTVMLLVISFFCKDKHSALRFLGVLVIGVLVTLAFLGSSFMALFSGESIGGLNDPQLQGLFYTHLPLINKTSLVCGALFLIFTLVVYIWKKERLWYERWWLFCIALLITNHVVFNIQVILGWTIWPQHFSQYTNVIVSLVIIILLSQSARLLFPCTARFCGWLFVVLLTIISVKMLLNIQSLLPILTDFQKQAPIMNWLNDRVEKECVVFVVQDGTVTLQLNRFVSAFTNCDVYNSYNIYQGVPRERVFHNLLVWLWMQGVTEKELPEFLEKENFWIRAYLFRNWRDMFCCEGDPWIKALGNTQELEVWYQREKERVIAAYSVFLKQSIVREIGAYHLNYVIIDTMSRVRTDLSRIPWLKELYSDGRYKIYLFDR